jgi:hypothetical protein
MIERVVDENYLKNLDQRTIMEYCLVNDSNSSRVGIVYDA